MKELYGYDILIKKFLSEEITAEEFESSYLKKYLEDKNPVKGDLFFILDTLFAEVDSFSNSPEAFPEDTLDEEGLRQAATKALEKLVALKKFEGG